MAIYRRMAALGGALKIIVEHWQGSEDGSTEDDMHPNDEADIRIADLGQARQESVKAMRVIPMHVFRQSLD